ncbi:MAG: valine--tRNA ligase [Saprospiraceae bacterium]|nr:valine--tRNA ligase [Saprospiraceae bacterium]
MDTHYRPLEIENKWYPYWMNKGYFRSVPDDREPFTIVMPPPNVTGVLHMGHMLNNTVQDILIRKARLDGKNACWVPGTDHASIATEAKVVQLLREKGIKKRDISREEFLKYAFEWKDKYGGIILDQLKRLGASADWDRTRFTMEDSLSEAVISAFVDLFEKGKLYRALRMTNWDPQALTVLSNEEVIYSEENDTLYFLQYPVEGDPSQSITIATVRPETILGDVAIAVHPEDERYANLIGKMVLVPLINRSIPIIADTYVDREFGTGALKITPAHDPNDYEIGQRHKLETIDILTPDGRLNESAQILVGEDRFAARKLILPMLQAGGFLVKTEEYLHKVGRSERTNVIVEPRLTLQWFLKMKDFAQKALEAVKSDEINFHPPQFINMYQNWLDTDHVRDWCISRQLWWGQRIPAWYYQPNDAAEPIIIVAQTADLALEKARIKTGLPDLQMDKLHQDEDVVDTWFSSWLWPISVFDGFKDQEELAYYYPTQVLVTGWDIIFFWVARMTMAGYEWGPALLPEHKKGYMPFKDVYFTGMVRDKMRRKMSKSLGNSPDTLALLDKYGADGVRFGMLSSAAAGNDIVFDAPFDVKTNKILDESQLCDQGLRFCNKMWNALRLVKQWDIVPNSDTPHAGAINELAILWMQERLAQVQEEQTASIGQFRLSEALKDLYRFIWDDFCSWYLELVKPVYGRPIDQQTYDRTLDFFSDLMSMLHPFMPFITEEIWHLLRTRSDGEDCMVTPLKQHKRLHPAVIGDMSLLNKIVSALRELRAEKQIALKETLQVWFESSTKANELFSQAGTTALVMKMANLAALEQTLQEPEGCITLMADTEKLFVAYEAEINIAEEREKLEKELDYYRGFVRSISGKLSNERFVSGAPVDVVDKERQKLADSETKIKALEESLSRLN